MLFIGAEVSVNKLWLVNNKMQKKNRKLYKHTNVIILFFAILYTNAKKKVDFKYTEKSKST